MRSRRAPGGRLSWSVACWLVLMALGALIIARSTFNADLSAFLPAHPDARQRVLIEQLQSGVASRTLMLGIDGGDAVLRADASRDLARQMRAGQLFEQVQNGDTSALASTGHFLYDHRYLLSPAMSPEHFSAEGLRDAIADTLGLLGTPGGAAARALLDSDPTGETQTIAESMIPAQSPRTEEGVWVSRQLPRAILLATTRGDGGDLDLQARAIAEVNAAFAPWRAKGLDLVMTGSPVFAIDTRANINHEVKLLAAVGVLVIGGLLVLAFGSVRALGVAMLPVVTGIVSGVAAVSVWFGSVHGITLAFGSTLIGEAVDYAIYYLIQARPRAGSKKAGWRQWRDESWPTVRLGVLTSVFGFAALLFSGFPGLAQLGVFSMAGLVGGALATRYVMPSFAPNGAPGLGLRRHLARLAALAMRLLPRYRPAVLVLGAAALVVLGLRWGHLWNGSIGSLSPIPAEAQALNAQLRSDLSASDGGTLVVVSGTDVDATMAAAEAASARLDLLVAQGRLASYESPSRFLPSRATQAARLASIAPEPVMRTRLAEATAGGPLPASRLAPFLDSLEKARTQPLLDRAALAGTALAPALDAMLFERKQGGWSALLPLHPAGSEPIAPVVRAALKGLPTSLSVQVVDISTELNQLYSHYLGEALTQALLGSLAVTVVLAVQLRSARRVLQVWLPLVLAVVFTLAGLALAHQELGILHLVGLLLVIAVGSNYGLYVDQWQSDGRADDDTLSSLVLANLTTVVSFALIALSDVPALSAIGRVVAPGALLALLMAAVLAKAPPRPEPEQPV